ncbi:MAG TPA: alpha/beta hydrolase [Vicinamibacterales bacterium]|nr:alpha/beta hydrolase [Vicinamibacterales bacterium]
MKMRLAVWTSLALLALAAPLRAATVDGANVHWTSTGHGAKTLILIHGWTCDETSWSEQVPVLSAKYRVITIDLPGHGRSDAPRDGAFSMDLFARAVEAVRAEAKVDRVILAGHSMGGPVVYRYAQLYPSHVVALILVDSPLFRAADAKAFVDQTLPRVTGAGGMKGREAMIRGMFGPSATPELQQRILKMMLRAPEATARGAMMSMADPVVWEKRVVKVPALAIFSATYAGNSLDVTKSYLPDLQFLNVPGTGHFVMMEKPAEFNQQVITFVERQAF